MLRIIPSNLVLSYDILVQDYISDQTKEFGVTQLWYFTTVVQSFPVMGLLPDT